MNTQTDKLLNEPLHLTSIINTVQICQECIPDTKFRYDNAFTYFKNTIKSADGVSKKCITCDGPGCNQANPNNVCSGCRSVYYCSRECQRADWTKHKVDCMETKYAADYFMSRKAKALTSERKTFHDKKPCYYCKRNPPVDPVFMDCDKRHVLCFDCLYDWQDEVDETGTIDGWSLTCSCGKGDGVDVQIQAQEKGDIYMWYAELHPLCKHYRNKYLNYGLQEHEKILKLVPDHISSSYSTAILLKLIGRADEALKLYDNIDSWVRALGPDYNWLTRPDIALSRADALKELGRWREAMAIYKHQQQVIENSDHKIDRYKKYLKHAIPFGVADCMIGLGMYQEALDHIERTITILGRRVCRSHKLKALALKGLGDLDGAIETMNRGILYEDPFQSKNKIENFQFYEELCSLKQNNFSNIIQSDMHVNVSSHVDDVMDEAPALFGDGVEDGPGFLKRAMSHGRKDRKGRTHLSEFLVKSIRMIDDDVNDYDDANPKIINE
jgi:tetratricopeptide (TPR) repeat protein